MSIEFQKHCAHNKKSTNYRNGRDLKDRYKTDADGNKIIEIFVKNPMQLFESRDPAPYRERDLDGDLAKYIISSAQEFSLATPFKLKILISEGNLAGAECESIAASIHTYFMYEADLAASQLRKTFRVGRTFLAVGLVALFLCVVASNFVEKNFEFDFKHFVSEGLLISGWVAMWRPIEVFLYDWWPIREKIQLLTKLSKVDIDVNEVKVSGLSAKR